jgi:hypothetical protein
LAITRSVQHAIVSDGETTAHLKARSEGNAL